MTHTVTVLDESLQVQVTPAPTIQVTVGGLVIGSGNVESVPAVRINATAATALSAGQVVVIVGGQASLFDPTNRQHYTRRIGLTTGAVAANATVSICVSGVLTIPGFGLTPDAVYYASSSGNISTTAHAAVTLQLGYALTADQFFISPLTPIVS